MISEPSEWVILADLPTAQPILKDRGEVIHVFEEDTEEPWFTNPEAEKLFGEGFFDLPIQVRRQTIRT